jgi:hypothetical protein
MTPQMGYTPNNADHATMRAHHYSESEMRVLGPRVRGKS